jgi:DNA-binding NtrC family response regulator
MRIRDKSILVIDDDTNMLRALKKVLSGEGASVTCAEWAGDAIDLLTERRTQFDLVITDLRMPLVSGLTVVYAVRQVFPSVPVIVLTAFGSQKLRDACLREGAAAFLEKPLDTAQLLAALERVIGTQTETESPPNQTGLKKGSNHAS